MVTYVDKVKVGSVGAGSVLRMVRLFAFAVCFTHIDAESQIKVCGLHTSKMTTVPSVPRTRTW